MITKELFRSIGFEGRYRNETENFYYKYFKSETDMHRFIIKVLKDDDKNNTYRKMINQVRRFVEMANASENIDHSEDSLKILFLCCCLESLCHLSCCNKPSFYKKFAECFTEEGRDYILSKFILTDICTQPQGTHLHFESCGINYQLTIDDFLNVIRQARNLAVHEGNYWEMQFFSRKPNTYLHVSMQTNKKILPTEHFEAPKDKNVLYHFMTSMQYECFVECFVKCCVNYILKYMEARR